MRKLMGGGGETLVETLAALLIVSLSMAMLAAMLQTVVRVVGQEDAWTEEYVLANNLLEEHAAGGGVDTQNGTVTIEGMGDIDVTYYINKHGKGDVIAYRAR